MDGALRGVQTHGRSLQVDAGMILTAIANGGDILRINGRYGEEAPLSKSDNASERA